MTPQDKLKRLPIDPAAADAFFARFPDEAAASRYMERARWPNGPVCPRCGDKCVTVHLNRTPDFKFTCRDCLLHFGVRTGSVIDGTKMPLRKILLGVFAMSALRKPVYKYTLSTAVDIYYSSLSTVFKAVEGLPSL